jgi:hypothetical protein
MRRTLTIVGFIVLSACVAKSAHAQKDQNLRPWWVAGEFGEGQVNVTSDQAHRDRKATFALGFFAGHRLGERARIGGGVNGWLLQAFSLYDPAVGESVSNVFGMVDVFPTRKAPLFFRGGVGVAMYTNDRPNGNGGTGWSWTGGLGYEIRLTEKLGLAPIVDYAAGHFGDVRNPITVETGRRYSAVEFKAAVIYHFGTIK